MFKVWNQLALSEVGNMHSGKGRAISFSSACHGKERIVFSAVVMDAIDEVGKTVHVGLLHQTRAPI